MHGKWILAAVLAAAMASAAYGNIILDGSGNVVNWNLKPFTLANQANLQQGDVYSTIQNGYSPINYAGVGHQPSPGLSAGGEVYDLEELHVRVVDHQLQLLLVTSTPWATTAWGNNVYLGDMMLAIDGRQFGIVTQSATQGLAQGALYRLGNPGDTVGIQQQSGSYWNVPTLMANDYGPNATVSQIIGPWAVSKTMSPGELLGMAQVSSATFNYGSPENGTFLLEFVFNTDLLGLSEPGNITARTAWGCGNDVIRTSGGTVPAVPEPGTVVLLAAGSVFMYVSSRRQRRRRQMA